MKCCTAVGVFLVAIGSRVGNAQRPIELTVAAGPVFVQSTSARDQPVGIDLRGGIGWRLPGTELGLRGEAGYTSLARADLGSESASANVSSVTLAGVFAPRRTRSPLRPYIISGPGVYFLNLSSGSTTHFGVHGGAGVLFEGLDLLWFLELRVHHITGLHSTTWIPATVGLRF